MLFCLIIPGLLRKSSRLKTACIGQRNNVVSIWLQYGVMHALIDGFLYDKSEKIEQILAGDPLPDTPRTILPIVSTLNSKFATTVFTCKFAIPVVDIPILCAI
jgi:hypothetical protein